MNKIKKISIGCDHAAFQYKNEIASYLKSCGFDVHDYGTNTADSVDYPDFAHPVAKDVNTGKSDFGILLCGSGNGVAMTANKYPEVRAALCWNKEIAALAKQHNNANIICIPARFISKEQTFECVNTFLNTPFEGGRHERRVNKIKDVSH